MSKLMFARCTIYQEKDYESKRLKNKETDEEEFALEEEDR